MSGTTQDWNETAPGGKAETRAAVASGIAEAMQAVALAQTEAKTFFTSYGPAVSAGHSDVNAPGRQGDPDPTLDAAESNG
jgi:hypothetical protein